MGFLGKQREKPYDASMGRTVYFYRSREWD